MVLSTLDDPAVTDVGFNAPNFMVRVEGAEIPIGIQQLVTTLEYESADGIADMMKISVVDPDFIPPKGLQIVGATGGLGGGNSNFALRDTRIFQPGNELTLSLGYGSQLRHIGRAIIRKTRQSFPQEGFPTFEVVAYTKDALMMDNSPEGSKKKKGKGGRRFTDVKFSDAVIDRANDYGFALDVDPTPDAPHAFIQKVGLSDYDFVNGLANINGYLFWVDGDEAGIWTLHFKNPETLEAEDVQESKFTFRYNDGNFSSLLAFEPELAIQGNTTKLKVQVKDPQSGRLLEAEFEEDNNNAPETKVLASGDTLRAVDQALEGPHTTASDIKIFLNDFSFEVTTNRRFKTEAELIAWAKQWFRRQRENFVLSRGATIGVESLMARQTHGIVGVGNALSGDYYFSRVKHILSSDGGYKCDFNCRKVVPSLA